MQLYFSYKRHLLLKNYLITLDKLHKTLVASVDEVNGQQNISPFGCHWEKKWNLGNYKGNQNRPKKKEKEDMRAK